MTRGRRIIGVGLLWMLLCGTAATALTYAEVRSDSIDVRAQKALLRMAADPATAADAEGMAAAVRQGTLRGIYAVDQKVPALWAKDKGGWWTVIPAGSDSLLAASTPPMIVFREAAGTPGRIEGALLAAWRTMAPPPQHQPPSHGTPPHGTPPHTTPPLRRSSTTGAAWASGAASTRSSAKATP